MKRRITLSKLYSSLTLLLVNKLHLLILGISQFEISEEDEDHLRFVLEADGTAVDDDYLKTVNAKLMILNRNEKWKQSKKCFDIFLMYIFFYFSIECIKRN